MTNDANRFTRTFKPLVSLSLLMTVTSACTEAAEFDDSSEFEGDDILDDDDVFGGDPDPLLIDPGATPPTQPAALPGYDLYEIAPPMRMEDLKPNYYMRLSSVPNARWHDLNLVRRDSGWDNHEPGASTEQNEVDWGVPVYAGVDGEVIACWRNSPYDIAYVNVDHKQTIGANFVIIRTDDDDFVFYAHMDTDSIPASICPNASVDGWLDNTNNDIPCQLASKCLNADTYLAPVDRTTVKAGQYIGRVGAHGNAAGAHLHVHVGYVVEDQAGYLNTFDDDPKHLVFDRAWYQPTSGATDTTAWSLADDNSSQLDLLGDLDVGNQLLWPSAKAIATRSTNRMADFDGDGDDDLLCHSTNTGTLYRDLAVFGEYTGTDWSRTGWCSNATQRLHTGDFDGNGRADLLCHDVESGNIWVDLANAQATFLGTNFTTGGSWCNADTQQLHVGDFDGDGDDDLLCHDFASGQMWIDSAQVGTIFAGTDTYIASGWCSGHYERLHLGKLDNDNDTDLLCHDTRSGTLEFDWASGGTFGGTNATHSAWCHGGGQHLLVGDVHVNGRDEIVCFDSDDGKSYVDWYPYAGTNWSGVERDWCDGPHQRVKLADANGDGRDDLLCFDQMSGMRWVDYAKHHTALGGIFGDTDWTAAGGWCSSADQALH